MKYDQMALDLAKKIDDLYAGGYHGTAQRTSRIQLAIAEVLDQLSDEVRGDTLEDVKFDQERNS